MATQRANVQYSDRPQPYFSKAAQRPQTVPADNTNAAPQNGNVVAGPSRRAQVDYKTNNSPVRSAKSTDEIFSDSYAKAGLQPANANSAPDQTRKARTTYATQSSVPNVPRTYKSSIPKIKRKKKVSTSKMALARVRVTTANVWIGSWAMFWYLGFQLPLAVISAAGLGMAFAVFQMVSTFVEETFVGSALHFVFGTNLLKATGDKISIVANYLFGFSFDPMLLFITPFALVFLLGLFQLILTWFVYSAMRINSLSGKAGGIKGLMFVLAGVGYAIPVLNLFPLIFLWMVVVWMHPK